MARKLWRCLKINPQTEKVCRHVNDWDARQCSECGQDWGTWEHKAMWECDNEHLNDWVSECQVRSCRQTRPYI
jgi:hypothetical protein